MKKAWMRWLLAAPAVAAAVGLGFVPLSAQGVRGHVLDAGTGAPLAGARVVLAGRGGQAVSEARTDADGSFFLGAPMPGRYLVEVELQGYEPFSEQVAVRQSGVRGYEVELELGTPVGADPEAGAAGPTASVLGRVTDVVDGDPVEGAEVRLLDSGAVTFTDRNGYFTLSPPSVGRYRAAVEHPRYGTRAWDMELRPDEALDVAVSLVPLTVEPDSVRVTERSLRWAREWAELQSRMRSGEGHFVMSEELERRRPVTLLAAIRGTPSLRIRERGGTVSGTIFFEFEARTCRPEVFLDGDLFREGNPFRDIRGQVLEVVEVYRGDEIPPRFSRFGDPCAVVAAWTDRSEVDQER